MDYRLTKMENFQNALISGLFGVFARVFLDRTILWVSQNHFQLVVGKKKLKRTCRFCMGYRLTKMEHFQNSLISRIFCVFARGFLDRTTLWVLQNHFSLFLGKKVENNLPILHGL